jgi:mRNA interferase MazF
VARRDSLTRGDIHWYRFALPDKRRPVLILGRDAILQSFSEVPVIPISTQARGLPWEVALSPEEGLYVPSVLKPEWIRAVPMADVGPWICSFPRQRWAEVRHATIEALGLDLPLEP